PTRSPEPPPMPLPPRRIRIPVIAGLLVVVLATSGIVGGSDDDLPIDRVLECTGTPVAEAPPYEEAEAPAEVALVPSSEVGSPTSAVVLEDGTMLVTSRPGRL